MIMFWSETEPQAHFRALLISEFHVWRTAAVWQAGHYLLVLLESLAHLHAAPLSIEHQLTEGLHLNTSM